LEPPAADYDVIFAHLEVVLVRPMVLNYKEVLLGTVME
jgi:hypothetical protein